MRTLSVVLSDPAASETRAQCARENDIKYGATKYGRNSVGWGGGNIEDGVRVGVIQQCLNRSPPFSGALSRPGPSGRPPRPCCGWWEMAGRIATICGNPRRA